MVPQAPAPRGANRPRQGPREPGGATTATTRVPLPLIAPPTVGAQGAPRAGATPKGAGGRSASASLRPHQRWPLHNAKPRRTPPPLSTTGHRLRPFASRRWLRRLAAPPHALVTAALTGSAPAPTPWTPRRQAAGLQKLQTGPGHPAQRQVPPRSVLLAEWTRTEPTAGRLPPANATREAKFHAAERPAVTAHPENRRAHPAHHATNRRTPLPLRLQPRGQLSLTSHLPLRRASAVSTWIRHRPLSPTRHRAAVTFNRPTKLPRSIPTSTSRLSNTWWQDSMVDRPCHRRAMVASGLRPRRPCRPRPPAASALCAAPV